MAGIDGVFVVVVVVVDVVDVDADETSIALLAGVS